MIEPYRHSYVQKMNGMSDPEKVFWQSINRIKIREICEELSATTYGHTDKVVREIIFENIRTYISQAHEYYLAAKSLSAKTSPLLYYYSFLNLTKAIVEFYKPNYHERSSSFLHGITRPKNQGVLNLATEFIISNQDGVWQDFLECIAPHVLPQIKGINLPIKDLFGLSPEVSIEFYAAFHEVSYMVGVPEWNCTSGPALDRVIMTIGAFLGPDLTAQVQFQRLESITKNYGFTRTAGAGSNIRYEKQILVQTANTTVVDEEFRKEARNLNSYITMNNGDPVYTIPVHPPLLKDLPQITIIYSLMYWLSRLVRYSPQDLDRLSESRFWNLVEGFISESPPWLLVLFEWEFYKRQTRYSSSW